MEFATCCHASISICIQLSLDWLADGAAFPLPTWTAPIVDGVGTQKSTSTASGISDEGNATISFLEFSAGPVRGRGVCWAIFWASGRCSCNCLGIGDAIGMSRRPVATWWGLSWFCGMAGALIERSGLWMIRGRGFQAQMRGIVFIWCVRATCILCIRLWAAR